MESPPAAREAEIAAATEHAVAPAPEPELAAVATYAAVEAPPREPATTEPDAGDTELPDTFEQWLAELNAQRGIKIDEDEDSPEASTAEAESAETSRPAHETEPSAAAEHYAVPTSAPAIETAAVADKLGHEISRPILAYPAAEGGGASAAASFGEPAAAAAEQSAPPVPLKEVETAASDTVAEAPPREEATAASPAHATSAIAPSSESHGVPPPELPSAIEFVAAAGSTSVAPEDEFSKLLAENDLHESETGANHEGFVESSAEIGPSADAAGAESTTRGAVAPPRPGREGGAEIFVLRPPTGPAPANAPNVIPIRPGALNPIAPPPEAREPSRDEFAAPRGMGDTVELTSQERDAFKEIARALGVRPRESRSDASAGEPNAAPADEPEFAAETPSDAAERPARADVVQLLDLLPIGALVTRGNEPVYLNRTLLDIVGYRSLEAFRADRGLENIFRGRDPAKLIGESDDLPLVAAGGELMNVDAHARVITWEGEPAVMIALRRSRTMEHQSALRAAEREARTQAAAARDLAQALDVAADGMIRLDETGRVLGMNRRAEALLGYDQKEAAGESFLMLLAPASQAEATAALEQTTREPARRRAAPGRNCSRATAAVARSRSG